MGRVGIGLVGAGFVADIHAHVLREIESARLVTVCSRFETSARALKERFGFSRVAAHWREVVADPEVHLVDICAPNVVHHDVAMAAIGHGKHVVVEKPLAMRLDQADAMIAAAERAGVKLMYAENQRFAPAMVRAKELIDAGVIGRPFLIRTTEMHSGPHADWFWDRAQTGGGTIMDMGVHPLFTVEWLMASRIVRVYAELATLVHHARCKNGAEDTAIVTVRFADGSMGELVNSWAVQGGIDLRTEVFGSDGVILVDLGHGSPMRVYSRTGYPEPVEKQDVSTGWSFPEVYERLKGGYVGELSHFVACVGDRLEPVCSGRDGRRVLELAMAAYQAAAAGSPVALARAQGT